MDENDKEEEKENLNFVSETHRLINLIVDNTSNENEVELYCCWAGDYESNFENVETLDTSDNDFKDKFEIEEKKLMRFV